MISAVRRLIVMIVLVAAANATAARADVRPPNVKTPLGTEQLSDEKTVTRWAHALFDAPIRRGPSAGSARVGRLRLFTEDHEFEVYLVLASEVAKNGEAWLRIRIPGRPNGRTGWTQADNLGKLTVVRTQLVIDRKALRATLSKAGKVIWSARIGVGKSGTPTPPGNFWIRERLRGLGGNGTYGPWAFGTSAYSNISDWPRGGVVGIHGTNQPQLIPGHPSHGCVRVKNAKITQLARLMPIGTPVLIV
jgi:hypothetical protein